MGDEADALIEAGLMGDDEFDEEYDFYANQDVTITGMSEDYLRRHAVWRPRGRDPMLVKDMSEAHLRNAMSLLVRRGAQDSKLFKMLLREKMYRDIERKEKRDDKDEGDTDTGVRLHG